MNVKRFLDNPGKRFPLAVDWEVPPSRDDLQFVDRLRISGTAFFQVGVLYLEVKIETAVERRCSRCLAPIRFPVVLREAFELEVPPGRDVVDLAPAILGSIHASLPAHPVCTPRCRGLCPVCGVNLNEFPDHRCDREADTPRTLKDFWHE
jgi:uncharacterized protein